VRWRSLAANPLLLALTLTCAGAEAQALVPPPGFYAAAREGGSGDDQACEPAPKPFTAALEFPSKYEGSGSARDQLNSRAYQRYKELTEPIHQMERDLSAMVGRYLRSGRPEQLQCALSWLSEWSKADALEGSAKNHTGKAARKWALASLASAYLRLKFSASQPLRSAPEQAQAIEAWLGKLGRIVVDDWKDQPMDKINNHEYWAAWAVMAAAVATDQRSLYDWSVAEFRTAARQVDAEGYLPNELKRETRALAYHNYSLGPLAMIAAFARANGTDLSGENNRALQRLADRVLAGVDDPRSFEAKTGKKQELDDIAETSKFAWLEPYCSLYPCRGAAGKRLEISRPLKTYRLGGNVTDLFAPEKSSR